MSRAFRRRMRCGAGRAIAVVWIVMTLAAASGCASRGIRPGTGDIAFRLSWQGPADLDLYVVAPDGERIDFLHREGTSGGILDIDCNVTQAVPSEGRDRIDAVEYRKLSCPEPLENVYWPRGRAPEGLYRVQVLLADGQGAELEHRYRLDVLLGRRVERSFEGTVLALDDAPLAVEVVYPSGKTSPGDADSSAVSPEAEG